MTDKQKFRFTTNVVCNVIYKTDATSLEAAKEWFKNQGWMAGHLETDSRTNEEYVLAEQMIEGEWAIVEEPTLADNELDKKDRPA
jgi:hypothetical protein